MLTSMMRILIMFVLSKQIVCLLSENNLHRSFFVDEAISHSVDESSLLRLDPDEKLKLDDRISIFLISTLTSPKMKIEIPTKSYVDSLHKNSGNRRDLSSVFNDEDNDLDDNKITNLDNELVNKNVVDDSLGSANFLRFYQTLQNYPKVSVGNDVYDLTKCDKIQSTYTTIIKAPKTGGYQLQQWYTKCNDKNNKNTKIYKSNKNKPSNR